MSLRILTTTALAAVAAIMISVTAASAGCCACGCGYQTVYPAYDPGPAPYYAPRRVYAPTPTYRIDMGPSFAAPAESLEEPVPEYGYRRRYPYVTYPYRHGVGYRHYGPRPWFHRHHGLSVRG